MFFLQINNKYKFGTLRARVNSSPVHSLAYCMSGFLLIPLGVPHPLNTKHLYNICTMANAVQMLYNSFVFAGPVRSGRLTHLTH